MVHGISLVSLSQVFGDIKAEIFDPYWEAKKLIINVKCYKDIEKNAKGKHFEEYDKAVENLKNVREKLINAFLDIQLVNIENEIQEILKKYPLSIITKVIPDAADIIINRFETAKKLISVSLHYEVTKEQKQSLEKLSKKLGYPMTTTVKKFLVDAQEILIDIHKKLFKSEDTLMKIHKENVSETRKNRLITIGIGIIGCIIGVVATVLVS